MGRREFGRIPRFFSRLRLKGAHVPRRDNDILAAEPAVQGPLCTAAGRTPNNCRLDRRGALTDIE